MSLRSQAHAKKPPTFASAYGRQVGGLYTVFYLFSLKERISIKSKKAVRDITGRVM